MTYNPFEKNPSERLSKKDIGKLVSDKVAEGYFVEYKSDFPDKSKIGRSIASFANTYGGWYIVGVATNEDHEASKLAGFSLEDYPNPVEWIRSIITTHIDPIPFFYPQLVKLEAKKAILVVYVPNEQETPFISKGGRLYRRQNDSSEPVPESSRYAVDQLVERGQQQRRIFKDFCRDNRTFSKGEDNQPWLNIYIQASPPVKSNVEDLLSLDAMNKLLKKSCEVINLVPEKEGVFHGNLPFDTAIPTYNSVILRQTNAVFSRNTVSMELFATGSAKLLIPLEYVGSLKDLSQNAKTESIRKAIERKDSGQSSEFMYVSAFDVGRLFSSCACMLAYFESWLSRDPLVSELEVKIELVNCWRYMPFFDRIEWANLIDDIGLPVIMQNSVSIPERDDKGFAISFKRDKYLWLSFLGRLIVGLGLPKTLTAPAIAAVDSTLDSDVLLETE